MLEVIVSEIFQIAAADCQSLLDRVVDTIISKKVKIHDVTDRGSSAAN
jgi:hypothetical protein